MKRKDNYWNDATLTAELTIAAAPLGRMPTSGDLRAIGRNDLALAASRRGGFPYWAEKLNLPLKGEKTQFGLAIEEKICSWLREQGWNAVRQGRRAPFDILVNKVRIDVKAAKFTSYATDYHYRQEGFVFNTKKNRCDLFLLCLCASDWSIQHKFFIPSAVVPSTITISSVARTKYSKYQDIKYLADML